MHSLKMSMMFQESVYSESKVAHSSFNCQYNFTGTDTPLTIVCALKQQVKSQKSVKIDGVSRKYNVSEL